MAKKRKKSDRKKPSWKEQWLIDEKAIEKRLQQYGQGTGRDKFGKTATVLAVAKPLDKMGRSSGSV